MRKANILLESLYGPGKVIRLLQVQELRCIKCTLYRKKANVYHKLERKEQSIMAPARLKRAKFQDLRSCEIRKFQENPWNVCIWWLVPSWPSKTQILMFFGKKNWKSQLQNISWKNPFCSISWICLQSFAQDCLRKQIFISNWVEASWFYIFWKC